MHIQIPLLPISERTTLGEMSIVFENAIAFLEQQTGVIPPLLLFEPLEESHIPSQQVSVSEAPEEILVIAITQTVREAVFHALQRVEAREPEYPGKFQRNRLNLMKIHRLKIFLGK